MDINNLKIYHQSFEGYRSIRKLIADNRQLRNDFVLINQIRRSSLSVLLNIAEGFATSAKQFARYLQIASGSANETMILLLVISEDYMINTIEVYEFYSGLVRQITALKKTMLLKSKTR